jgi:hypothetical protein
MGLEMIFRLVPKALILIMPAFLAGCEELRSHPAGQVGVAEVTSVSGGGGLVRFSGVMAGIALDAAEQHCIQMRQKSAVPISFYKIGADTMGRDQIMTFECK